MRGSRHWNEEEERKCKICKKGIEDWNHILRECEETKGEIEMKVLLEDYEVIKKIKRIREKRRREEEEGEGKGCEEGCVVNEKEGEIKKK